MDKTLKLDIYKFNGLRIFFRPNTEDEQVIGHSFDKDIFYKEIPSFKVTNKPIIIDIGAHIGTFSILSALKFPNAKIYAIEASKETFEILQKNVTENDLGNIITINSAVSSMNGKVRLYHSIKTGNWGHSITKTLSKSFEEVTSTTLSSIVSSNNIEYVDLLKFNCEGAEFEIIMHTDVAYLSNVKFAIVLYHLDLISNKYSVKDLKSKLDSCGFYYREIKTGKNRGWLIAKNKRFYNKYSDFIRRALAKIKNLL